VNVVERRCTVQVPRGIHCRVAVALAETVAGYRADVAIAANGRQVGLSSIVEVLSLGISRGTMVVLSGRGPDAVGAVRAVEQVLIRDREC